ncbi:MAG: response regulator [Vulcanimicrobiota bacterium]
MSRILLVEDSPTQALKYRHILEQEGWQVEVASSPDEALELLNRQLPDLLVTDYYLPGMRGNELIRLIRLNVETRGLPILMLTVADSQTAELVGLESGADDYLEKSVEGDILRVRVRALLRRHSQQVTGFFSHASRRTRILVVEDSPTFQAFLLHELGEEGYQVEAASSGEEAMELCATSDFDAVLVDLVLPGMQGIELCKLLEARRQAKEECFAIIILTSKESSDDMTRGLEAGADDFLNKSSDLTVVKARIRGLVRRKRFQEENARISRELKERHLETLAAQADARARARVAEEMEKANKLLEAANRELSEKQTQLVQSEKMASLGQLVAGIAHEINNPMAFVLTNLHNIRGWLKEMSPEVESQLPPPLRKKWAKTHQRLDSVEIGLERVRDLVVRLRTFSRLDEGEFKFVDVHESIDSVILLLEHRLNSTGITLEKRYNFSEPLLGCLPGQLNQVVMNLLTNAIDAVQEVEGEQKIIIATAKDGEWFLLQVKDNGVGISKSAQGRVFDPFYTTKPVGLGTGLGMSISYGIIQAHQGTIDLQSRPGEGSEFRIRIPLSLENLLKKDKEEKVG